MSLAAVPGVLLIITIAAISTVRAEQEKKSASAAAMTTPPVLDGRLDDAVWRQAPLIQDLKQVEPVPGREMSESTEVRILYDQTALYIGVRCNDRQPAGIQARVASATVRSWWAITWRSSSTPFMTAAMATFSQSVKAPG